MRAFDRYQQFKRVAADFEQLTRIGARLIQGLKAFIDENLSEQLRIQEGGSAHSLPASFLGLRFTFRVELRFVNERPSGELVGYRSTYDENGNEVPLLSYKFDKMGVVYTSGDDPYGLSLGEFALAFFADFFDSLVKDKGMLFRP